MDNKTIYICYVKTLLLLFAFYILLLPCLPCTDTDECVDPSKTEILSSSTNHNEHQHTNEACNPFCSCACCGQIFYPNFQLDNLTAAKPLKKIKLQFFYTNISLSSNFYGNIWQPPKFS